MTIETNEFDCAICPLPVIRLDWTDDEHPVQVIGTCGQEVQARRQAYSDIGGDGTEGGGEVATWEVRCAAGHVLLVPDYEDFDHDAEHLGYTPALAARALGAITVTDGGAR